MSEPPKNAETYRRLSPATSDRTISNQGATTPPSDSGGVSPPRGTSVPILLEDPLPTEVKLISRNIQSNRKILKFPHITIIGNRRS